MVEYYKRGVLWKENLAKLLYAQLLLIVLVILFLPLTASAYFGSESSVYIIAKNMPSYQVCYLDILEYNSLWNESGRISELEIIFPSSRIFLTNMTEVR